MNKPSHQPASPTFSSSLQHFPPLISPTVDFVSSAQRYPISASLAGSTHSHGSNDSTTTKNNPNNLNQSFTATRNNKSNKNAIPTQDDNQILQQPQLQYHGSSSSLSSANSYSSKSTSNSTLTTTIPEINQEILSAFEWYCSESNINQPQTQKSVLLQLLVTCWDTRQNHRWYWTCI
jgi:hypothetical protein